MTNAIIERSLFDPHVISQLDLTKETVGNSGHVVLMWRFSEAAKQEIGELREKNSEGRISPEEYAKLDSYRRIGHLLDMMSARARCQFRVAVPNG